MIRRQAAAKAAPLAAATPAAPSEPVRTIAQPAARRYLTLTAVLAAGFALLTAIAQQRTVSVARWPDDVAVYAVDGWAVGPLTAETLNGISYVSRDYRRADSGTATLSIATSPEAKRIYRAGAEIPFLGNGYAVAPASPDLVPPTTGRGALLARRGSESMLVFYTYGERRGRLGNGALGWSLVALDATLGRRNGYYRAYLMAPQGRLAAPAPGEMAALADTLFARLAAWYGGRGA